MHVVKTQAVNIEIFSMSAANTAEHNVEITQLWILKRLTAPTAGLRWMVKKMKDDLISRRAIFHELLVYGGKICPDNDIDGFPITIKVRDIKETIKNMPSIGMSERQGKWKYKQGNKGCYCSECGGFHKTEYAFCHWCGAKMGKED